MITNTLADQVYEKLETEILTGVYKRGEIFTENALCENLGVSRTPIREAIRRLEQEHIIESSGKGIVIVGISPEDIKIIYEIRSHIEGLAAAACAENASEEQIKEMSETVDLQSFYISKNNPEKVKEMDSKFHEMLYKYSGSAVYYDTLMPLHTKTQKVRKRSVENSSRAEESTQEHKKIIEAIAKHDRDAAFKAANDHVEKAKNHILSMNCIED